jgi:ssDNA-binding Zn-finger/Zn-ribbon topoisomerase 1
MFNVFSRNRGGRGSGGRGQGGGQGRGGGNKPGSGPGGNCVCPNCGHTEPHQVGQRCIDTLCPKCGTKMVRE